MLKVLAVCGSSPFAVDADVGTVGAVAVVAAVAGFAAGAGAVVDWEGRSQPLIKIIRSNARNRGSVGLIFIVFFILNKILKVLQMNKS